MADVRLELSSGVDVADVRLELPESRLEIALLRREDAARASSSMTDGRREPVRRVASALSNNGVEMRVLARGVLNVLSAAEEFLLESSLSTAADEAGRTADDMLLRKSPIPLKKKPRAIQEHEGGGLIYQFTFAPRMLYHLIGDEKKSVHAPTCARQPPSSVKICTITTFCNTSARRISRHTFVWVGCT